MQKTIKIGDKSVGAGAPVFVIAEAGVNHNGDVQTAKQLIEVAIDAGADAVKFQSFKAESLVTSAAPKAEYQLLTTSETETQLDMLRKLELLPEAHHELLVYCKDRGIMFLSTPFDQESADLLESMQLNAFKISSGDLTNRPLLEHVAKKGKPLIISTGMATLIEVEEAVAAVRESGCDQLVIMHCVSNYPSQPAETNLRAIETLARTFNVPVGFSDHTAGIEVALGAVALGATVIEKHFTLDRMMPGPDHRASLEPDELRLFIRGIRTVESSLGNGVKVPAASELEIAKVARRSLVAAQDIPSGSIISRSMIDLKRPGTGLPPGKIDSVVGRNSLVDIARGDILTMDMFK